MSPTANNIISLEAKVWSELTRKSDRYRQKRRSRVARKLRDKRTRD